MVDHSNRREQLLTRAREARSRDDVAAAGQIYRQLIEQYPDDAELKYFLGMTCWLLHQQDEAEALIELAIKAGHQGDSVYYNFALLLQEQGKAEAAIEQYQHALALNPELENANNNLGFLYFTLGQLDEAAECLRKEIANRPNNIAAHNNLGNVLKEQFKFEAARGSRR